MQSVKRELVWIEELPNQVTPHSGRLLIWERRYPGSVEEIGKIFGTQTPHPFVVSEWKRGWAQNSLNTIEIPGWTATQLRETCKEFEIHPYFYQFVNLDIVTQEFMSRTLLHTHSRVVEGVVFWKDEHLVRFKLSL